MRERISNQGLNSFQIDSFILSLLETNHAWQNCSRSLDKDEQNILINLIIERLQQFTFEYMFIKLPIESKRTNLQLRSIKSNELKERCRTFVAT